MGENGSLGRDEKQRSMKKIHMETNYSMSKIHIKTFKSLDWRYTAKVDNAVPGSYRF